MLFSHHGWSDIFVNAHNYTVQMYTLHYFELIAGVTESLSQCLADQLNMKKPVYRPAHGSNVFTFFILLEFRWSWFFKEIAIFPITDTKSHGSLWEIP